jgi:hypothetical protein
VVAAQRARWAVDASTSLAWWQVNPNYGHLWATTCPSDPSWQPGEGRDAGMRVYYDTREPTVFSGRESNRIPLSPRGAVTPVCRQAVRGEVTAEDQAGWRGVRGTVAVRADSLVTGLGLRDAYARRAVLHTARYPELRFTIDSLVDVVPGDTMRATAVGSFEAHGVRRPTQAPLMAWQDSAGFRVRAEFSVPATALIDEFKMSRFALGMGVVSRRWHRVHMGVDVILRPAGP